MSQRLASPGIDVAAPDHLSNTLFDPGAPLSGEFITTRAKDVSAVLDALLDDQSTALPDGLRGRFDANSIGVAGYSYGAVTAEKVLQDDPRFIAGMIIATPVENPDARCSDAEHQ